MIVRMKYLMLLLVTFALIVIQNGETDAYLFTTYFDTAGSTITVKDPSSFGSSSSGILKSHFGFSYANDSKKTVTLSTISTSYGILLSIRQLDFRPNRIDNLTFLDVHNPSSSVMYNNLYSYRNNFYDSYEFKTFNAPSGQLAITFQTSRSGPSSSNYNGFELIYTSYSTKFSCGRSEFRCSNSRCIAKSLTCDGHNHCGDRSDQICSSPRKVSVIGISFGVVFLVIAIAFIIFIFVRRLRSGTEVRTVISHPPPTNHPSSYPQPGTYYPPPPPAYSQYSPGQTNPAYH